MLGQYVDKDNAGVLLVCLVQLCALSEGRMLPYSAPVSAVKIGKPSVLPV